ncbi:hypothetical protein ACFQ51_45825 [Streptomyces kaempferi]
MAGEGDVRLRSPQGAQAWWDAERGATYQILRTQVGGVSDRLCAAEGLASLEVVHQTEALASEP